MTNVVIVDAVRTPIGRRNGGLSSVHPGDLLGTVQKALLERTGIDPALVGQVVTGCVSQVGEQAFNIGRTAWLAAGLPLSVPNTTVDTQCGSSQQATNLAASLVGSGAVDVAIACGVEVMSRIPIGINGAKSLGLGVPIPKSYFAQYEMTSQFDGQIIEVDAPDLGEDGKPSGTNHRVVRDEGLRETSLEGLAKLKPVARENGVHTAGNSSQISDGASALLMMTEQRASQLGLTPIARVVDTCLVGVDPILMLTGPIDATQRLLTRTGLSIDDIDTFEINEAFASVVLAWQKEVGANPAKVNPNGGAIALGHPLGGTGGFLMTKAIHELVRSGGRYGLISMCCGGGIGTGTIVERL
jgi:acetyl-CoA C-acetyltransferase